MSQKKIKDLEWSVLSLVKSSGNNGKTFPQICKAWPAGSVLTTAVLNLDKSDVRGVFSYKTWSSPIKEALDNLVVSGKVEYFYDGHDLTRWRIKTS